MLDLEVAGALELVERGGDNLPLDRADLQAVCESHGWRYCFIGALAVDRASLFTFPPDVPLRVCSAEDLLVLKAFADRPKDWLDIEGILIRQSDHLDWAYVRAQLEPLAELKGAPELVDKLERLRDGLA